MAEERQGWYPGKFAKGLIGRAKGWMDERQEAKALERRTTDADTAIQGFEDSGMRVGGTGPLTESQAAKQDLMQRDSFRSLRDVMQSFDPADKSSVMNMQRLLNASGITDVEGNPLEEDGMMGEKTLSALRGAQQFRGEADKKMETNRFDKTAHNPSGTQGVVPDEDVRKGFFAGGRMGVYEKPKGYTGVADAGSTTVDRSY
jgi:hypothetical protein